MEAEQVIGKILSDARSEAEKIKSEAEKNASAKQNKFDAELAEYKKQTDVLAKKAGDEKKAHLLAAARMDIAQEYLLEKRKILDGVFAKAQVRLQKLDDKEYRGLMAALMLKAVETGDEEVLVDKAEKRIDHEFVKQVNHELGAGYKGDLRLSEERLNITAGFVLRRGRIKNNASLDVLLSQARDELEIELAKELFGKQ